YFARAAATAPHTPSLHDALPIFSATICRGSATGSSCAGIPRSSGPGRKTANPEGGRTMGIRDAIAKVVERADLNEAEAADAMTEDRKSTRLNSSHVAISYAVLCL